MNSAVVRKAQVVMVEQRAARYNSLRVKAQPEMKTGLVAGWPRIDFQMTEERSPFGFSNHHFLLFVVP
jgi:hypothetical protein